MALIEQGNLRMEDPLAELRYGVEQVGTICLSHLYQFGPPKIKYQRQEGNKKDNLEIPKRLLRRGIKLKMQGITVVMNPDAEFKKWMYYYQAFAQEPLIAQDPIRRTESLRMAMRNGRIQGRGRILPSMEEMRQQQIEMQKEAMKKLIMERVMARQQQTQQVAADGQAQADEQAKRQEGGRDAMVRALQSKAKVLKATNDIASQNGTAVA